MNRFSTRLVAGIVAVSAALLTAYASGGWGRFLTQAPPHATDLLFLGNSLTYIPVDATYVPRKSDWGPGGWGMAASAPEKDYVHITAKAMGLPFVAMNLYQNERFPDAPLPSFTVNPGTIVVIQLGENGEAAKYGDLVARAKAGFRLVCFSTYGPNPVNDVQRPKCEAAGGTWIDDTDIWNTPAYMGQESHPSDAGMAEMARRLLAVLKP